ncbi:MAG: hypothetical protein SFV53_01090, partial [Rickettsiales bacterium]|nr:hypothetical protein [Rickettsiales bacterium]
MDYKVKLKNIGESCILNKVPQDAEIFLSSLIAKNFSNATRDLVFIAQNDAEMAIAQKQIEFFAPHLEVLNFYAWDCLPYDRASPKPAIIASRIKTLYRLATRDENQKFFIITSVNSVLQKTIAPNQINNFGLYLQIGSKISLAQIAEFLVSKGYERQACANNVGEFAVRGGLIDIVMEQAADLIGYRIDFFGDEIESIKVFDPITQITNENVKSLQILPASEVILNQKTVESFRQKYRQEFGASSISVDDQLYLAISQMRGYSGMEHWLPFFYQENLVSFFDYLKKPVIFFSDKIFALALQRQKLISEYYQARVAEQKIKDGAIYNPITPNLLYFSADELKENLAKNITIQFNQFDEAQKNQSILDLEIKAIPDFALAGKSNQRDPIDLLQEFILKNSSVKNIVFACLTASFRERISKIFLDYKIATQEINNFSDLHNIKAGKVATCVLQSHFGFYSSDLFFIGEQAIFGEKVIRKKTSAAASQRLIEEGLSIAIDELVVHRDHGIGRFKGINLIDSGG